MPVLSIDIETYSSVDLLTCGVYKYAEAPDFTILLVAYAVNGLRVSIVDLTQGKDTDDLSDFISALTNPDFIKTAYNANFERTCLSRYFGINLPPEQWQCTAVHSATLGLPRSLGETARVLGLPEDKQKMAEGKSLIQYFCKPCRPTKLNGGRERNLPEHAPDKWNTFKEYCKQDVEVERAVRNLLMAYPVPTSEWELWQLDQRINDRGVKIDRQLVTNAIKGSEDHKARLETEAIRLTGIDNPNSIQQLKAWLEDVDGVKVESLNKATVPQLIKDTDSTTVERVLRIRQELGKTSVGKYQAMERSACEDDRVRGALMFFGSRTGRWAGRIVQVQNLPQNKLEDLALARELLQLGDTESIEMLFGNLPGTLSQLIRTAIVPETGRFIVCDFSAIEARVIAWLAGEDWRMDVFNSHGKIYEASASQMFRVPLETIAKGKENYGLRQKGKIAELALGYGGSVGALTAMGALKMGLTEEELPDLVTMWRKANPAITQLWWDVDSAAVKAVRGKTTTQTHGIRFICTDPRWLFIELPSGRRMAYVRPKAQEVTKFGRRAWELTYEGVEQGKKSWGRIDTYGPKLVENLTQAIARDCLAESLLRVAAAGHRIVMHVHDELIIEAEPSSTLKEVEALMAIRPTWSPDLPLRGDGYECPWYMKA
jgi:DNA polymerase